MVNFKAALACLALLSGPALADEKVMTQPGDVAWCASAAGKAEIIRRYDVVIANTQRKMSTPYGVVNEWNSPGVLRSVSREHIVALTNVTAGTATCSSTVAGMCATHHLTPSRHMCHATARQENGHVVTGTFSFDDQIPYVNFYHD